jgi:hypothetical protein
MARSYVGVLRLNCERNFSGRCNRAVAEIHCRKGSRRRATFAISQTIPSMTNWMSGVCEANGINLHYLRTGGCKPPLVLLHGLTGSGACWIPLARALDGEYDVVMPDARRQRPREFEHAAQRVSVRGSRKRYRWIHPRAWACGSGSAGPLDGRHDCGCGRESNSHGHSRSHPGGPNFLEPRASARSSREMSSSNTADSSV